MPIKILRTGVPTIGNAKIGQPGLERSDGKQAAPEKFDHIELTGTARDKAGRLVPDMALLQRLTSDERIPLCGGCARSKALGFEKGLPVGIPIQLLYSDLDLNLPHRLALYRGRTAFCTGDGENAMRLKVISEGNPPKFGEAEPYGPCGNTCADFAARRCKPHGVFRFMLGIQESVGGCFAFRTTSWNSLANLVESLKLIQTATGGILEWIPLWFEVVRQTVQPKDGPANTQTIARVIFRGSPQALLGAVKETLQFRAPMIREIRQLEASIDRDWKETPEEVEAVVAEFGGGEEEHAHPAPVAETPKTVEAEIVPNDPKPSEKARPKLAAVPSQKPAQIEPAQPSAWEGGRLF